jgi:hypothetical protein
MYKGISISPLHGSFAPGYEAPPSDLENLIARRERELADFMDQSVIERLGGREVNVSAASGRENVFGNLGAFTQNAFSARFIAISRDKGGL